MTATRTRRRHGGFTLLELLLAISILVVISAAAYQLLKSSVNAITHINQTQSRIRAVRDLQWALRSDLHSMIRPLVFNTASEHAPLVVESDSQALLGTQGAGRLSFLFYNNHEMLYLLELGKVAHEQQNVKHLIRRRRDPTRRRSDTVSAYPFASITAGTAQVINLQGEVASQWPSPFPQYSVSLLRDNTDPHTPAVVEFQVTDQALGNITLVVGLW